MAHHFLHVRHLGPLRRQQAVLHSEIMLGDDEQLRFVSFSFGFSTHQKQKTSAHAHKQHTRRAPQKKNSDQGRKEGRKEERKERHMEVVSALHNFVSDELYSVRNSAVKMYDTPFVSTIHSLFTIMATNSPPVLPFGYKRVSACDVGKPPIFRTEKRHLQQIGKIDETRKKNVTMRHTQTKNTSL